MSAQFVVYISTSELLMCEVNTFFICLNILEQKRWSPAKLGTFLFSLATARKSLRSCSVEKSTCICSKEWRVCAENWDFLLRQYVSFCITEKEGTIKITFQNYKRQYFFIICFTQVDFKICICLPLNRICYKLPVSIVNLKHPYIKQESFQKESLNTFHGQVRRY